MLAKARQIDVHWHLRAMLTISIEAAVAELKKSSVELFVPVIVLCAHNAFYSPKIASRSTIETCVFSNCA